MQRINHWLCTLAATACALLPFPGSAQAQQSPQILQQDLIPAVAQRQVAPIGVLPADQRLQFSIMLPLRNQDQLTSFLARLQDPSSPDFRKYLTVEEFTEVYGPSEEDFQAVVAFARANGFTVTLTPRNRMIVGVNASVRQVENAFHVTMKLYRHPTEDRTFYSPDRAPSVDLSVPLSHIAGLDNFSQPHSWALKAPPGQGPRPNTGSGPGGLFLPEDLRAAYYGNGPLTGAGQSIGLVEYEGFSIDDVVQSFNGEATAVAQGNNFVLTYTPAAGGGPYTIPINNEFIDGGSPLGDGDAEAIVDIISAIGMAPGISQIILYNSSGSDVDLFNQMAADDSAKLLSCSWGWGNNASYDDPIFQELAAQGQSLFVASGDTGSYWYGTPYPFPTDDPYITSVGGTDLTTTGPLGAWVSETGWNQSTGGPGSEGFALPYYQNGLASYAAAGAGVSATVRNAPDVAADADFNSYACSIGSCDGYGGTSLAAPRWAGYLALANQQAAEAGKAPIGFLNPTLYTLAEGSAKAYANDFHDIVTGTNSCNWADCYNPTPYSAGPGYDLVTGWGSMNGPSLIDDLVGADVPRFMLSSSSPAATIQPGAPWAVNLSVTAFFGFTGNVALTTSALPSGVSAVFNPPAASATTPSTLTFSTTQPLAAPATITVTGTSGSLTGTTTVNLAGPANCAQTPIAPWLSLDGGATWLAESSVNIPALPAGLFSVVLWPLAGTGGVWNWTGPNGFTSSSQHIGPLSINLGANTYVVAYTNTSGCVTTQTYTITGYSSPSLYVTGPVTAVVAQSDSSLPQTIVVQSVNGFAAATTLTVSGLPAGVTASFSPSAVTPVANGQATSSLTLTASASATVGTYVITVTGTSGSVVTTASIPVMVVNSAASCGPNNPSTTPYIATDYSNWDIADAETVPQNTSVGLDMDANNFDNGTWVWSGPNGYSSLSHVSRAISGMPLVQGLNTYEAVFVDPLNCASTQAFQITVVPAASPGLMVAIPTLAMEQGSSASNTAIVTNLNSLNGAVALSAAGVPAGVTAVFSPASVAPAANGTEMPVLTLTASASAPVGTYTVTVTAAAGGASSSVPFTLTILPPGDCASIAEVVPYIQVGAGPWQPQASETVSTTASVNIAVTPVPFMWGEWYWAGPNGYFLSTGIGNAILSIPLSAGNNTYVGGYISPVDSCQNTLTFNIDATGAQTFDIAAAWPAAVTLSPGNTWTNTISVTSVNGFSSPVTLSAAGLPAGVIASFSPTVVTPAAGAVATSQLTLAVSAAPSFGSGTVSVTGTANTLAISTPIALGVAPTSYKATLDPTTLSFATQNTGSTSAAKNLTLKNTGTGTVSISSIAVTGVFFQSNGCGTSLAPGASCTISVTFTPVADGVTTGTLTVSDTTTTSPHTVSLSGTGTGTPCGGNICFSGDLATTGQYAYTSGFNSPGGTITATLTVPSGTTWRFSLDNQTANQSVTEVDGSGPLTISYNAPAGTYGFFVAVTSGSGAWRIDGSYPTSAPTPTFAITDNPSALTIVQGAATTSTITITVTSSNGFSSPVTLTASGLPNGVTAAFSPASVTPAANATATSTLTLTASATAATGTSSATVTGASGSRSTTVPIALTVAPIGYSATLAPATLSFAAQNTGSTSAPQTVTLKNTGTGTVAIAGISVTGAFSQSNGCGISLAPGASCSISVSFTPVADGAVTGTLTVTDNTATSLHTVSLSGTGTGTPCSGNICFSGSFSTAGQYAYTPVFNSPEGTINATLTAPAGTSWRFSLDNHTANQSVTEVDGSGPLTITYNAPAGTYAFFVAVTSGSGSWRIDGSYPTTAVTPTFALTDNPSALTIVQGATATSTITVSSSNGFSSPVALTASGLANGVTASFSPASVTPAANAMATSTLTLTASATAATGTSSATVSGVSGSRSSTVPIAVTVSRAKTTPAVTVVPSASSITSTQGVTVVVSVSGGSGNPTPTGSITLSSGAYSSAASPLSAGSVSIGVPAGALTVGTDKLTANYTPDTDSSASYISATGTSSAITVTPVAAAPTFSPAAGIYTSAQTVTIADSTSGAMVYYTTNGATPTTASTRYTAAIKVSANETIQAMVVASGYANSPVATAAYTIDPPAATPTFSPAAGSYTSVQTVSIADTTAGAVIYYTTNGSAPTALSALYTSPITVGSTQTLKAIATAASYSPSAVATAAYTITLPAATPTFSVVAGTYTSAQSVVISDITPDATIYYTTNGSTPTTSSTKYTAAVKVAASETIKAIAAAAGYSTSAVASASYTIAAAPTATTTAATSVNTPNATLNGTVVANNATTQYWFAYGTSKTSLTTTTTKTGALTGTASTKVSAAISGLKTKTTYYFQVVASNAVGTTQGTVLSFTTN
jgi:VCBS repeat-containing protein